MSVEGNSSRVPRTSTFLRDAGSLAVDTPSLILLTVVAGGLIAIPLVGPLLGLLVTGYAHVHAQRSRADADRRRTERSLVGRLLSLLLGTMLFVIVVVIGLFLLILPGLYLLARLWLFVPAIMLDRKGPVEALGDSWTRTGGNVLTVLGFVVVVLGGSVVVSAVVMRLLFGAGGTAPPFSTTQDFVSGVTAGPLNAVLVGGAVLMYLNFDSDPDSDDRFH